jgi:hypothetical protein
VTDYVLDDGRQFKRDHLPLDHWLVLELGVAPRCSCGCLVVGAV